MRRVCPQEARGFCLKSASFRGIRNKAPRRPRLAHPEKAPRGAALLREAAGMGGLENRPYGGILGADLEYLEVRLRDLRKIPRVLLRRQKDPPDSLARPGNARRACRLQPRKEADFRQHPRASCGQTRRKRPSYRRRRNRQILDRKGGRKRALGRRSENFGAEKRAASAPPRDSGRA